jgi:hypothetical protein
MTSLSRTVGRNQTTQQGNSPVEETVESQPNPRRRLKPWTHLPLLRIMDARKQPGAVCSLKHLPRMLPTYLPTYLPSDLSLPGLKGSAAGYLDRRTDVDHFLFGYF